MSINRVSSIIKLAEDFKITDRRKFITELQDLYLDEDIIETINKQTRENDRGETSWNNIMLTIHQVILCEAEKNSVKPTKGASTGSVRNKCCNALETTIQLATSSTEILVSSSDLMAMIIQILKKIIYEPYHETYMRILGNVLPNKSFRYSIAPEQWVEIVKLNLKFYDQCPDNMKQTVLEILTMSISYGGQQTYLVMHVKKVLPLLENLYNTASDNNISLKLVYQLTHTVCQQIATENRITICEFSEKILPSTIVSHPDCQEKWSLLLFFVKIHHPGGAGTSENGACAHNWAHWRRILHGIYVSILRETKSEMLSSSFLKLACEVYRQMMLDSSYSEDVTDFNTQFSQEILPSKRRRLSVLIEKPFDLLIENDLKGTWPSIQILTLLFKKYPESLRSEDYITFLTSVTGYVTASLNNEPILDSLCALCTVLVNIEKQLDRETLEMNNATSCWEKIWDTILRTMSMNQNEIQGHTLLQSIIENRGALNPNGLLSLYVSNAIRWSPVSVKTLLTFCEHTSIPEEFSSAATATLKSEGSTRISLISWCLNLPSKFSRIPVVEVANLLTILVGKFSYDREFRDFRELHELSHRENIQSLQRMRNDLFDNREEKFFEDLERCHMSLNFRQKDNEFEETKKMSEMKLRIFYVAEALELVISSLNVSSNNLKIAGLEMIITKLTIVGKFLSNFLELNIVSELEIEKLRNIFEQNSRIIFSFLTTKNNISQSSSFVNVVKALEILFSTSYHQVVSTILISTSSVKFLEIFFDLSLESENDENSRSFTKYMQTEKEEDGDSRLCVLRKSAYKVLTYFTCISINEKMTELQKKVLRNLMKTKIYQIWNNLNLRRVLEFLKICGMEKFLGTNEESLRTTNNFIRGFYDLRSNDETAIRGILDVLPDYVENSKNFPDEIEKLLEIVSKIDKRLLKKEHNQFVHGDFVKCVSRIVRLNPSLTLRADNTFEFLPLMEVLLKYIKSPFYYVRLEVAQALGTVCSSKKIQVPSKIDFLNKIISVTEDLFSVEGNLSESEKSEEYETRTNTILQIFASLIRSDEFIEDRVLYWIIKSVTQRNVELTMLEKAIIYVTKSEEKKQKLIQTHLNYLLSRWFEDNYSLHLFPWKLLKCDSIEDFSKKHINTILSVKLQRLEFKHLVTLCSNLEVPFSQTVENCFPTIMTLLMTMIVDDTGDSESRNQQSSKIKKADYARAMFERLRYNTGEFEVVADFNSLLQDKLPDILIDLVKRLRDDEHFEKVFSRSVYLPAANPPNFSVHTTNRCFLCIEKILVQNTAGDVSLIEYLVENCPSVIQRVSETLFCYLNEASGENHKLLAFQQYHYFGSMILPELKKRCFDPMSFYIVRDTSYSLLSLMKDESLVEVSCDYFYEFLKGALPGRADEVKEILSFVVSSLVPIVQSSTVEPAMKILNYLIIEKKELLGDAIEKLDSFPNLGILQAIKRVYNSLKYQNIQDYTLKDEIEHFLNATNVKTLRCSHEELVHLKNQLSTRKQELQEMYAELEKLRGFAEDCASSALHRLIYKLVQLTRVSDNEVSLEAAKCLGQLGPADLTTMILYPENVYAKETEDQTLMLTFHVVCKLIDYLVDSNTNLRRASSEALYKIFATSWGRELVTSTSRNNFPKIHCYIYPFNHETKRVRSRTICIDIDNWRKIIDRDNDLWTPASYESYDKWIEDVTSKLLDCFSNFYTSQLKDVCHESVEFCEMLLPRLVNLIQTIEPGLVNDVCVAINRFFSRVYEALKDNDYTMTIPESPVNRDVTLSYKCVRSMINVVNFMRIQSPDDAQINLDFLYIAKAAQYCSAFFTSVLYAELWCQSLLQDSKLMRERIPGGWIFAIDCICELKPESGKILQSIIRDAYMHIGDPDAIYGCGLSHLVDPSYKIQRYTHLRRWDKVTLAQDVEMSSGSSTTRGMLQALRQSGLQSLLGRVISTVNKEQENVDDFLYETAWRLADWNIVDPRRSNENSENVATSSGNVNIKNISSNDYYASHYRALKCLRDEDYIGLKTHLDDARTSLVVSLSKISIECSQTLYPILSQLQMLREIEDFARIRSEERETNVKNWRQDSLNGHDFQWVEPILSQRLVMYQTTETLGNLTNPALIKTHLDMAEIAEEQGYLSISARSLDSLSRRNLPESTRDDLIFHEAFLAWKQDDQFMGRYLMSNLIKNKNLSPSLRAKALRVYGNWMAATKLENPQAIVEKYYEDSIRTSQKIRDKNSDDIKNLLDAQADLAQFADSQYQQIVEFMQTPQYESLEECTKLKKDESKLVTVRGKDEQKAIVTYQRQVLNDVAEIENTKKEKIFYLLLATKYYLKTLQTSQDHDLLVFRLVSLWLDNTLNEDLNKTLSEQLGCLPSYKFIILLPQLAPHMSDENDIFTSKINELMERCAKEHPHHTLPVLLALKNTQKDNDFKQPEKPSSRRKSESSRIQEPRIRGAEKLINKLLDSPIRPIICEMITLSEALIALAYYKIPDNQAKKTTHVIPKTQAIMKIRHYTNACVPTVTMNVKPRGGYSDVVGIKEYEPNFDFPGGVNAPKKVICIGTDGIRRKQLVKGHDDLRQDAVMQQVFTVMNTMLRTCKESRKRKLHIRTYKIVPLSQRSGILEWCENTLPISQVLCDKGGMHAKYYPDDWPVHKCRAKLGAVDRAPNEVKLETFLECCKNLRPAFHHFFLEKFPSAEVWFERRLAYIRSVATTSMVGYVLGLGDRHLSNILIDQRTAEVVHIDFGIAFAQGKVLPIPETVPFRLTRDMEVAMGTGGVEGVMTRSCEETVTVLRNQRQILITLLQVLLYDPLFTWAITPVKSYDDDDDLGRTLNDRTIQERGRRKTNKLAKRALLKIEQKLQGTEDGGISSCISGQVERLIQQARDPVNLCRLFSGWQAYL